MAAGTTPTTTSLAVLQLHPTSSEITVSPSQVDSLEQIALVLPEKLLCLKSITLALCVPVKNRLEREEKKLADTSFRHPALCCERSLQARR